MLPIDSNEPNVTPEHDRTPTKDAPVGRDTRQEILKSATNSREEETDRLAIDRAEDEGMIGHPRQTTVVQREQEVAS